jgi:tRNA uridine 5-carboxymethylaminomethyl modification enzyme
MISEERWQRLARHEAQIACARQLLSSRFQQGLTFEELLRRPEIDWWDLCKMDSELAALDLTPLAANQVELESKYAGYIRKQQSQIDRQNQVFDVVIPEKFDYFAVPQLRAEAKQKLTRIRPRNLGQASRVSGITPADIAVLVLYVREPCRLTA